MKIFKKFFKKDNNITSNIVIEQYNQIEKEDIDKNIIHKNFLKEIENDENNRLNLIESKTAQLVSITGITFSLLGVLIPIVVDKIASENFFIRLSIIILLLISFVFYFLCIFHATKNFNIKKFIYSKPSFMNVLKYQNNSSNFFIQIEINDLIYSINNNIKTNNKKANNLIKAYLYFRFGIFSTSILVLFICTIILLLRK